MANEETRVCLSDEEPRLTLIYSREQANTSYATISKTRLEARNQDQAVEALDDDQGVESFYQDYVCGVTKLNNKLFVLQRSLPIIHCTTPFIYVFESVEPFHRLDSIEIKEIGHPEDIVSSRLDDCLYVSDSSDVKFIWKVTASDHKVVKWLPHVGVEDPHTLSHVGVEDPHTLSHVGVEYPHTLSVTKDGRLLVLKNERDMSSSNLKIFNRYATRIETVKIHIAYAHHVVETSTGNFVVCHTKREEVGPDGRREEGITEVSRDGKRVIRRFYSTCETQRLEYPVYLWIGTDDKLLVADQYGQVIMLDTDMNWSGIIVPANDKERPWRLHFDEDEKQLLVGLTGKLAGAVAYKLE